jgi:outer membrane protein assembly factor BamB
VKQVKILFLIAFSVLSLILASCVPGGGQPAQGWSGTAYHDGIVYSGSMDGKVVAVNSSTGNLEWSYTIAPVAAPSSVLSCGQASAPAALYATPVVDGDLVYIGSYSGKVLALSISARSQYSPFPQVRDGEWLYPRTNEIIGGIVGTPVGTPVVGEEAIYVTSSDGRVYSLDREFGDLNWESDVLVEEGEKKLWMAPGVPGDTIYVSAYDGHIYALSAETGDLLPWAFESEAGLASSPVIYEDTIFVGSFDNKLYAIKISDGKPSWNFTGGKWFWATPVVNEGVVYAGCLDGKIYALNAETGQELWQFESRDPGGKPVPIVSSPVVMDNLLIVADESGNIYVFDMNDNPQDGELVPLKTMTINAVVLGSFCAQEGTVYVRAQDNHLYALDIDRGGLDWKLSLTTEE